MLRALRPAVPSLARGSGALPNTTRAIHLPRPVPNSLLPSSVRARPSSELFVSRLAPGIVGLRRGYADDKKPAAPPGAGSGTMPEPPNKHGNPIAETHKVLQGAKSEIQGVAHDLAQMISGGAGAAQSGVKPADPLNEKGLPPALGAREVSSHSHGGSVREDFMSITSGIIKAVPQPALIVGSAGLIPYIGTAIGTVFLAREASRAGLGERTLTGLDYESALSALHTLEHVQITYGAIILSFLGAIHWGFEFAKLGGEQGYQRLLMGVVPVLLAWPTTFLTHGPALAAQWAGFTGMWFIDQRASWNGWTTQWYSTYRFYLSVMVGFSIIATLAGTGYYGAGAGASQLPDGPHSSHVTTRQSSLQRLDRVRERNFPTDPHFQVGKVKGTVAGDIEVDENDESYLKLRNVAKEEEQAEQEKKEQEEKKAEEQRKNQEFQDKRDEHQQDNAAGQMKSSSKDRTGKNANEPGGEEERSEDEKAVQTRVNKEEDKGKTDKAMRDPKEIGDASKVDKKQEGKSREEGGDDKKKPDGGEKKDESGGGGDDAKKDEGGEKGKGDAAKKGDDKGKAGEEQKGKMRG